jgi:hypothetical protein
LYVILAHIILFILCSTLSGAKPKRYGFLAKSARLILNLAPVYV